MKQTLKPKDTPYLERLAIEKSIRRVEFNIESQLQKLCAKIPLLQAIRDIPMYAKIVKELCLKKPRRKKKEPPTIHFIGKATQLIVGKIHVEKYEDLGNPIVLIRIRGVLIPNTLIDLGEIINIMTLSTMQQLDINALRTTPTIFELVDRSKIKLEGVLDDEIVSLDSWEYLVDLFVLKPR